MKMRTKNLKLTEGAWVKIKNGHLKIRAEINSSEERGTNKIGAI